jgi:predicted permease
VLCVIILEVLRGGKLNFSRLLLGIAKNPIIIGTLAGIIINISGLVLPAVAEKAIADIAALVTPMALILLGAGLRFTDTLKYRRELLVACATKLLLAPLLFVLVVKLMGFGPVAVTTAMAFSAVPTAISSYVQAKEMQADGGLAGQIVAVTTVLSIGTLFLWVSILSGIGWIG